jgi:hypothetical protein
VLHKFESSAHTSSARVAPVGPIGLTTEAKSGNHSDKDCRPHLERGSKRFAVSIDRGAIVETFPFSDAVSVGCGRCNAGVRADPTCSSGRVNLRCGPKSRVDARLAARSTMCLPLGHNGTAIRICRQDKADRPRCRNNQRGATMLGRVRADNACRPKYLERKLSWRERKRCFGCRRGCQGAHRRIPSYGILASTIG